ncbi:uncharacterized protein LOC141851559 [Brevipalpus obovatus]|uniref:uncharacterized protein LOC141851559 n=1 Tax=Brevipalpus obovatus TaxID=246614 RepID=UPI003D9ECF98
MDSEPVLFECEECSKTFQVKKSLLRHLSEEHNRTKRGQKCAICDKIVTNILNYTVHAKEEHNIEIEQSERIFDTIEDFEKWKSEIETSSESFFAKKRTQHDKSYYECSRSGTYVSKGHGVRHLKTQGSRKIDAKCPAMMIVHQENLKFHVKFYETHMGHENELRHIDLSKNDREKLASYISFGLPRAAILQKIRTSWKEEEFDRIHLLNRMDLVNITKSYGLDSQVVRDKNDLVSIESLVEEMGTSVDDPIVHYSPPDDENHGFVLIISTRGQRYMMERYSEHIIAIDSTHGTNDYDFQLTTVMVVDENRNGFPGAFMYSKKLTTSVFELFFEKLRDCGGIKLTKTFMSDDYKVYYNAYVKVLGAPENYLLCSWHVIRNWDKHLLEIGNQERRREVMGDLLAIQRELDETEFLSQLKFFIAKYSRFAECKEFLKYFNSTYVKRTKQCSSCYRINLGINTNMHLTQFHPSKILRSRDMSANVLKPDLAIESSHLIGFQQNNVFMEAHIRCFFENNFDKIKAHSEKNQK